MLVSLRKKNNFSQMALAKELGVSQQAISHWENGKRDIPIDILLKLSELFGCTLDELVKGGE